MRAPATAVVFLILAGNVGLDAIGPAWTPSGAWEPGPRVARAAASPDAPASADADSAGPAVGHGMAGAAGEHSGPAAGLLPEAVPAPTLAALELELGLALEAKRLGRFFECARWAAGVVSGAERLAAAGQVAAGQAAGQTEGDRRRASAARAQAEKSLREVAGRLTAAAAACAAAWVGAAPELSLRFARVMLEAGRPADAAAEALALLAADPGGPRAKDAAKLLRDGARTTSLAGGVHHSVYRVAALVPLSGDYAAYGQSLLAGLRLAVDDANASAPLPIRLLAYDTGGEAWRAAALGRQALEAGAGVFVGEALSVPTLVLAGVSQAHGIPLLSPSATEESVGETGPAVFQTGLGEAEQGRALARYAIGHLRVKRIAVAVPETLAAGAGDFAAGFMAQAAEMKASVFPVRTPAGSRDGRGAVNDLRRAQADALLLPADPARAEIWISAVARERYEARLLGSEALDPQNFHSDSQQEAEGLALVSLDYALPDSVFARVDSLVRARYGMQADRFVRRGYLTGRLLAQTLGDGAATPAMLAEALSRRVLPPAAPGRSARGFVRPPESEARVPIYLVRRGGLVRVR